jgi:hypothetical protein
MVAANKSYELRVKVVCQEDAPELQTASFNGRVGEKAGAGIIIFNDKMGIIHKGVKFTYAYHLMFLVTK